MRRWRPPGISFLTYEAEGPHPLALFEDTPEVTDGCFYLAQHGECWLGPWPAGLRAELDGERLRIVDERGQVLAT
jgi:hypothetical protein